MDDVVCEQLLTVFHYQLRYGRKVLRSGDGPDALRCLTAQADFLNRKNQTPLPTQPKKPR